MTAIVVTAVLAALCAGALGFPLDPPLVQYHAQDELGQYSFGYSGGPSAKHEERTADGVVRGSFAYVDPNGQVQTRSYIADDMNGFRVLGSDIPSAPSTGPAPSAQWYNSQGDPHWISRWSLEQTPSLLLPTAPYVRHVPAAGSALGDGVVINSQPLTQQQYSPLGSLGAIRSQYHAQDEAGQYTYGYSNENSSKSETKTLDGTTRGSYSYVDPNGRVQTRNYIADANGFRVSASDLP